IDDSAVRIFVEVDARQQRQLGRFVAKVHRGICFYCRRPPQGEGWRAVDDVKCGMIVSSEYVDIPAGPRPMRMFVARPAGEGKYPGILCYSDIFQLTGPMLRACTRLAGYGFVIAAPEIYHRIEPLGAVIPFDDAGRTRGLEDAQKTPVAHFDEDRRAALDY